MISVGGREVEMREGRVDRGRNGGGNAGMRVRELKDFHIRRGESAPEFTKSLHHDLERNNDGALSEEPGTRTDLPAHPCRHRHTCRCAVRTPSR